MTLDGRPGKPWNKNENRINELVFIGKNLNDLEINNGFNSCIIQSIVLEKQIKNLKIQQLLITR